MSLNGAQKDLIFEALNRAGAQSLYRGVPVVGLAVSGGGDSMALLALARLWATQTGAGIAAVTVDHGLREGSHQEAQRVATYAAEIGVPHEILMWEDWDGSGNLQDAARRARTDLISAWAHARGIGAVATGHTRDDQAETFLMRLARGSGVDGLSAISPSRHRAGLLWVRPLLDVSRSDLRDYLAAEGLPWTDDPSNEDTRFDRIKMRKALDLLDELGIKRETLSATAGRMARARRALDQSTSDAIQQAVRVDQGDVLLDWPYLEKLPSEIRNRIVAHTIMWISGTEYRPRASGLDHAIAAMQSRRTHVLGGCQMSAEGSARRITREAAATQGPVPLGELWDGRWKVSRLAGDQGLVSALGEQGIRACPDWRESGLPRASLLSSPAVWIGDRLLAAPLAGFGRDWKVELISPPITQL